MTAAHAFYDQDEGIEVVREARKIEIVECILDDSFSQSDGTQGRIPFKYWDYLDREYALYDRDAGLDLVAIELTANHRELLKKGGVTPLSEVNLQQPAKCRIEGWLLIGLPCELENTDITPGPLGGVNTRSQPAAVYVAESEPPDEAVRQTPRFAGTVPDGSGNIKGMSGGPVFARCFGDRTHYLAGVQSTWIQRDRQIFACPVDPLVEKLKRNAPEQKQ